MKSVTHTYLLVMLNLNIQSKPTYIMTIFTASMSSIHKIPIMLLFLSILLLSCKTENPLSLSPPVSAEIMEIFNVSGSAADYKPTTLRYKDVTYMKENSIFRKDYYEVDNTLKGFEVITKEGDKGVSNYFAKDSTLLAIYHISYYPGTERQWTKVAFEGSTREKLRSEEFQYHEDSDQVRLKTIYDASGKAVQETTISLDDNNNEILVSTIDLTKSARVIVEESFEILKQDENGQWLERLGKKDGVPFSYHRRSFKTNTKG